MPNNLPGVGATPTLRQFEDMMWTAVRIKNKEHAIELGKVCCQSVRMGLRRGEVSHDSPSWLDLDTGRIVIPAYNECECGHCKQKAKTRAKAKEESRGWHEIFINDMWCPKTPTGARFVPFWYSPRLKSIVITYHKMVLERRNGHSIPKPPMAPRTVQRRYRKLCEITDSIKNPEMYSPRGGRAAAAMYWARVLSLSDLLVIFGWEYPQTAAYYMRQSLTSVEQQIEWAFDQPRPYPEQFYQPMPEFSKLRPDDESELIELDSIQPETSPSNSSYDDEEALLRQGKLDQFSADHSIPSPDNTEKPEEMKKQIFEEETDDDQKTLQDIFNTSDRAHADIGILSGVNLIVRFIDHIIKESFSWILVGTDYAKSGVSTNQITRIGVGLLAITVATSIGMGSAGLGFHLNSNQFSGTPEKWILLLTIQLLTAIALTTYGEVEVKDFSPSHN